jgi:hypothetical protein
MARKLSARQKRLLDGWLLTHKGSVNFAFNLETSATFPIELLEALQRINDYETLHWDINRYISDKAAEERRNSRW